MYELEFYVRFDIPKKKFFIVTAVKTSNLIWKSKLNEKPAGCRLQVFPERR
jgi:hypothetical protein